MKRVYLEAKGALCCVSRTRSVLSLTLSESAHAAELGPLPALLTQVLVNAVPQLFDPSLLLFDLRRHDEYIVGRADPQ